MPFTALAIGAGVGLLKSAVIDGPKANRERTLAAATQRFSPWTHLQAGPVQEADPLGSALTFGGAGASIGAAAKTADAQNALMGAQTGWLNRGGSPLAAAATSATGSPWGVTNFNYGSTPRSFFGL